MIHDRRQETTATLPVHPVYGISAPERGWVPGPSYLLRRDRVLRIFDGLPAGRLLEIGCGAGALLYDLSRRGFAASALEVSAPAREIARYVNRHTPAVRVFGAPEHVGGAVFDYVVSCEVLEHIEDDGAALRQWRGWLKPAGLLLLSVPAHRSRWSASDRWAGHCRRYDRADILAVVEASGFEVRSIESYGFPLANMLEPLRAIYHGRQLRRSGMSDQAGRSLRSGIERKLETRLYPLQASLIGTGLMRLFFALQALFAPTDLGAGYLLLCRRKDD